MRSEPSARSPAGKPFEPPFLQDSGGELAIPLLVLPSDYEFALPILSQVLHFVDGRRNARDVALKLVEEDILADDGNALSVVRGCLRVLFRAQSEHGRSGRAG
jgi:hypothetical protein